MICIFRGSRRTESEVGSPLSSVVEIGIMLGSISNGAGVGTRGKVT